MRSYSVREGTMRSRIVAAALLAAGVAVFSEVPAYAGKKSGLDRQFSRQIPKEERPLQALNRLTFGPRPGDLEHLRKVGLKKWIDAQLHPDSIVENPDPRREAANPRQPLDAQRRTGAQLPGAADRAPDDRGPRAVPRRPGPAPVVAALVARLERGQGQAGPGRSARTRNRADSDGRRDARAAHRHAAGAAGGLRSAAAR